MDDTPLVPYAEYLLLQARAYAFGEAFAQSAQCADELSECPEINRIGAEPYLRLFRELRMTMPYGVVSEEAALAALNA
jgi:hypothetical protein